MTPPLPVTQYLVLEHMVKLNEFGYQWYDRGLTSRAVLNGNFEASPVQNLQPVVRGTLPPYVTVKSPSYLQLLISKGAVLNSGPPLRVNTFLVPRLYGE